MEGQQDVLQKLAALIQTNDEAPEMEAWTPANLSPQVASLGRVEGVGMFGMTCVLIGLICMAGSTAYFYMAAQSAKENKFFEVLTMLITGIATCAYMTMYSGAGYSWIIEHRGEVDPFYWARYIDWILTTPLMLWDVLALAGASNDDILMAVFIDMLMIGFGCVGAQTPFWGKWVFFLVSMLCFVHVCQVLMKYNNASKYGEEARALYQKVSSMTIVLWSLYPVVWVVAEGTRIISPSLEACCYMIMDVLSKCLFGFMIVQARGALTSINGYEPIQG